MRKSIALAVLAVTAAVATTPAMAWGDREQGILLGIGGTLLAQQLVRPPVVVAPGYGPAPVYNAPPYTGYAPPVMPVPSAPVYGAPVVPYYPGTVYPDFIQRPMYKAVDVFVPECNCYRTMMVRIN